MLVGQARDHGMVCTRDTLRDCEQHLFSSTQGLWASSMSWGHLVCLVCPAVLRARFTITEWCVRVTLAGAKPRSRPVGLPCSRRLKGVVKSNKGLSRNHPPVRVVRAGRPMRAVRVARAVRVERVVRAQSCNWSISRCWSQSCNWQCNDPT